MHFKSTIVPHPQLKLVNKFGNLNNLLNWLKNKKTRVEGWAKKLFLEFLHNNK